MIQITDKKISVFKEAEKSQISHNRNREENLWPYPVHSIFFDESSIEVIDENRNDHDRDIDGFSEAIEKETRHEQKSISKSYRCQIIKNDRQW